MHSPVGRASVSPHTVSGGVIGPSFTRYHRSRYMEDHGRTAWLPSWLPRGQQVLKYSLISGNVLHMSLPSINKLPSLALKTRGIIARSLKQEYQRPYKKDLCPPNNSRQISKKACSLNGNSVYSLMQTGGVIRALIIQSWQHWQ